MTTHASKLWTRSEAIAEETDNETENIFADGIYNVSLFMGKGKIKEEQWAEISASWRIDYWDQPDFDVLKESKTSITRTLVDDFMIKTSEDRQKEFQAIRDTEQVEKNRMKEEILILYYIRIRKNILIKTYLVDKD